MICSMFSDAPRLQSVHSPTDEYVMGLEDKSSNPPRALNIEKRI